TCKQFMEQLEMRVNYENPMLFLEDFEKIADGTTSTVYKAREKRTRVEVAVKRINLNLLKDKQLVINELSITKKLNHANIVQFVDSFLLETELWIVMEYMQAGTLADVVASSRMIEQQIATVSKRLLEGLSYLHSRGIIHRDIKSDCVLIREDGEVKLSDFGFSIELTPETPRRRSLVGTPYWMSPEIISREPYNTAADIWSFGILVFEMVDGEPPYFNDIPPHAMRKIKEESVPVMANLSRVSPMLQGFVEKMIVKDPLNRLSASELLWHPFLKKACSNHCLLPLLKK
ncbi:hypothetical protein HELRODRAFT_63741, partial [Helobdella robusta]|uniref:non-specific serine/threonine protein kinase n=1 Tax=Helobdella robusta TaxID=6412 RepID=T1FXJ5_HELRO